MDNPKIISLFSGYGGLEMGVAAALGGADTVVTSDLEPGPCAIEAFHGPHTPNLGDITKIDKATLPAADVLVGGSPCQSMSYAGLRTGMHEGTRSGLWSEQCDAIAAVRPRLAVWENVQAATGASASSRSDVARHDRRVEALKAAGLCACDEPVLDPPAGFTPPNPGEGSSHADKALLDWARGHDVDVSGMRCGRCGRKVYDHGTAGPDRLGGRDAGPVMRALGRVLADLSLIGYDAIWRGIEAADVGAPHHRARLFVVAWPRTPPERPPETDLFRELDALPAPRPARPGVGHVRPGRGRVAVRRHRPGRRAGRVYGPVADRRDHGVGPCLACARMAGCPAPPGFGSRPARGCGPAAPGGRLAAHPHADRP